MDQFIADSNTLLAAALAAFAAFVHFLITILEFFLVFARVILTALHVQ